MTLVSPGDKTQLDPQRSWEPTQETPNRSPSRTHAHSRHTHCGWHAQTRTIRRNSRFLWLSSLKDDWFVLLGIHGFIDWALCCTFSHALKSSRYIFQVQTHTDTNSACNRLYTSSVSHPFAPSHSLWKQIQAKYSPMGLQSPDLYRLVL